jgi:hypothetical protein
MDAFEQTADGTSRSSGDIRAYWGRWFDAMLRDAMRAENCCSRVLEQLVSARDALEKASADALPRRPQVKRSRGPIAPRPTATEVAFVKGGRMTFVVAGVEHRMNLSALRTDLLAILAAPTKASPDHLVGFKTIPQVVHALRSRGWEATRSSVTTEVGRLRGVALGRLNRGLIETRRNAGYRFRLLRSAAMAGPAVTR